MIRVCAWIGSMAKKNSHTAQYADMLVECLSKLAASRGEEVYYDRILASDVRIEYCRSCVTCFFRDAPCPMDAIDDMPQVKQRLLDADIILLGSPVYLGTMSGVTKSLLDRISYWAHRFELAGKVGYAFATTSNSYGQEVVQSLTNALYFFGCTNVEGRYGITQSKPVGFVHEDALKEKLQMDAQRILDAYDDPIAHVDPRMYDMYRLIRKNARFSKKLEEIAGIEPRYEVKVNASRGMIECLTFDEYAKRMMAARAH